MQILRPIEPSENLCYFFSLYASIPMRGRLFQQGLRKVRLVDYPSISHVSQGAPHGGRLENSLLVPQGLVRMGF